MDLYRKDFPPNSPPCLPVGKSKERSWPGVLLRTKSCINVVSESLHPQLQSISGLVAEYIVAIDVTRVRFPADASLVRRVATLSNRRRENSATGTRTRVARVRAEYPNQLDYSGFCHTVEKQTRASRRRLRRPERPGQARPGLEPAIPDSVSRCLIHWATGPSGGLDAQAFLSANVRLRGLH